MTAFPPGALAPAGAPAPRHLMLLRQTRAELRLAARKPEQLVLNLVIPVALLVALSRSSLLDVGAHDRKAFAVASVLALAVMSSAFTGQAIATGFERDAGVLKRLGATPLPRSVLLLAKTLGVLGVQAVQVVVLVLVALGLGWDPHGSAAGAALLVALGTATFSGLGLLLGGTLRGTTSLAAANVLWVVLLLAGGLLTPLHGGVRSLLPTGALADGLRVVLESGALDGRDLVVLGVWAVGGLAAAARFFSWE